MDWKWLLFSFDGRINRAKWWLVVLILVIISAIIWLLILPILGFSVWSMGSTFAASLISLIVTLIFAYPATAAMVKRLNDRERPMWLVAVFWAPTILTLLAQLFGLAGTPPEASGPAAPTTLSLVLSLLTLVVGIWALVELGILKGTPGPNRHGPDPLARA
jgi:uncharacterized membrane protein YhaH (DUF805 family)